MPPVTLAELSRRRLVERVRTSSKPTPALPFANFCREAWSQVDAARLEWSWHLDEITAELEVIAHQRAAGKPSDLAINVPPGSTKSRIISVLWHPWVWSWWPESKWITSSYDDSLAARLAELSLQLLRSDWYQSRWPVRLVRDSSRHAKNVHGGERFAVGIGSNITGSHAHFILGDDLVKEQLARLGSPAMIAKAVNRSVGYWFGTLSTRAVDYIAARVLIHQRLHRDDPSGVAVAKHGYDSIVFPGHFDPSRADPRDHRTVAGEPLCSRLSQEVMARVIAEIGPTAAAAQIDQDPQPPGGQLLRAEYMAHRWSTLPAELTRAMESGRWGPGQNWIIAGDLAFKSKRQSKRRSGPDYVVYELWCSHHEKRYLIDQVRGQWGFRESKLQLALFALRHQVVGKIILEDAANAAALEDDLTDGGLVASDLLGALEAEGVTVPSTWSPTIVLEPHGGGTLARTQSVEGVWYSGAVILPANAAWVDQHSGFVDEHLRYSGTDGETDDQVSTSSLALLHLKSGLPGWAR